MKLGARPLVLCYHAVSETWLHPLSIGEATLIRQIKTLLLRRYRPVRASDVVSGTGRFFHVTFDDAYRSVEKTLPVLARLEIPITVFACPDYAEDGRPLAIPELARDASEHPDELATMGWDAIRAVAARGIEIGSHSLTHAHLTDVSDRELTRELRDSRVRLEDELGRRCRFLAYPYGEHDARVRASAGAAGYEACFDLSGGASFHDRLALPRIGIYRKDRLWRVAVKTSRARGRAAALRRRFAS